MSDQEATVLLEIAWYYNRKLNKLPPGDGPGPFWAASRDRAVEALLNQLS